MQSLPSHRQFLTSLIVNLSAGEPPPTEKEPHLIPPDRRRLLLTLHVLFPSLLLPALDLLDRRLVTGIRISDPRPTEETITQLYVVQSLGTTLRRRNRDTTSGARSYVVRPKAWNCSCASFALDSFPARVRPPEEEESVKEGASWQFGGMSLDGLVGTGEDVPCCKHLLACLLTERWPNLLGDYVERRAISKDELAGIVAGF